MSKIKPSCSRSRSTSWTLIDAVGLDHEDAISQSKATAKYLLAHTKQVNSAKSKYGRWFNAGVLERNRIRRLDDEHNMHGELLHVDHFNEAWERSCVGATRRRSRAIPIPSAPPTLGRGRPNSPFGVRARHRGWVSTLRAGERLTTLTSPPLDQNVRARAPPRALPASHLTDGRRMAAKAPRARSHGNPMTRAQR
jgi:hypothetical protein